MKSVMDESLSTASSSTPYHRDDLRLYELDGEALIFDGEIAGTHRLNETALFIWRQCDGACNADRIAHRLSNVYDVDYESALHHVEHTITELTQRRLVVFPEKSPLSPQRESRYEP